jgi:hypothetical protein
VVRELSSVVSLSFCDDFLYQWNFEVVVEGVV